MNYPLNCVIFPQKLYVEVGSWEITQLTVLVWIRMLWLIRQMPVISYGTLKKHSSTPFLIFLNDRIHTSPFLIKTMTMSSTFSPCLRNIFLKNSFFLPLLMMFLRDSPFFYSFWSYILTSLSVRTKYLPFILRTSIICWCLNAIWTLSSSQWNEEISKRTTLVLALRRMTELEALSTDMMDSWSFNQYFDIISPDYREMNPKCLPVLERQNRWLSLKDMWFISPAGARLGYSYACTEAKRRRMAMVVMWKQSNLINIICSCQYYTYPISHNIPPRIV